MAKILPWQRHMPTIYGLRHDVEREGVSEALLAEIATAYSVIIGQPYVRTWQRRREPRIAEVNDHERAYSMGQSSMAVQVMRLYLALRFVGLDAPRYRDGASAMMDVQTDNLRSNRRSGLRSRTTPSDGPWCSWFHGTTSTKKKKPGTTLNKHLDAVEDLMEMADLVRTIDGARSGRYRMAATEGANQLFFAPPAWAAPCVPNLHDFVARRPRPELYYAWRIGKGEGRYVKARWKNAHYHVRVLNQVARILMSLPNFRYTASVRRDLGDIYEPYTDGLPDFDPLRTDALSREIRAFYENYSA